MPIRYEINKPVSVKEFVDVLKRSTLAERRPVDDFDCMKGVIENSNLIVSARDGGKMVGIARSLTDFHYACYLSDLAVDIAYQKRGIGKKLIDLTQRQLKEKCKIILLAAPAADEYYPHLGFEHNPRAWILPPGIKLPDNMK